ncbi:MAG: hypothetical protein R2701_05315 [Acidimicrobiales bacterium]
MRRRSRLALAAALAAVTLSLAGCGGRTDGGTPIPTEAATTTLAG